MNIVTILNQIDSEEIVLPAIQRNFVWSEDKIVTLMDSILRGYPIGITLMWETYKDIQYRAFEKLHKSASKAGFHDNKQEKKLKLVLDGQQRLQSLYIAIYGQYNGKYLYFNVLSGRHSDDFEEDKYLFYFETDKQVERRNLDAVEYLNDDEYDPEENEYFCRVSELFNMGITEKQKYRKKLTKLLKLNDEDESRLETNISKLDEVLTKDPNILKASIIDEDKAPNNVSRQSESDVLEIFVRINRQGTPLSRSDLIFSMLKLNWRESATALPDFVERINEGNSFSIDIDFVIRCLYAVSDLGAKFDIDMLRKKSNMEKMQDNFEKCCSAIEATVDYIQQYCWISNNKAFGGTQNLVPFVYYLFYLPKHELPNNQIENFRKAFFIFCFASPFSRYADSRLAKFIKRELFPLRENHKYQFPYASAIKWVNYWEGIDGINEELIQSNPRLALHIIQQDLGGKAKYKMNTREMDHIFPRSILREKGFDESKVNHFANFWLLAKGKNINKTNKHPKQYFEDVPDAELNKALIERDMLDYRRYNNFIYDRGNIIIEKLVKKIGFNNTDFDLGEE